ncbi:hypothetical protein FNV43_RR01733 [Rhamnella rubrinervis]|uniref:Leucine-rich repeat-containing N-terminal plant-type domain-containing protein n=1 Tax=Rhamnella rubrinervis TaxID=2594499 RepID=A0A8K0HQZ5_9ROSA|nr:hypothetical protein FNV43_RR01733 [Rhamnella rubrinervis]
MNVLVSNLILSLFLIMDFTCSAASFLQHGHGFCHDDERFALLQFKKSFIIDRSASGDPFAYPKVETWNTSYCCSWDGVECEKHTGHVIGVDLTSSFLYGSFNSTNTLFNLSHLQWLSLADNDFRRSRIPSEIGRLSRLTYLNLSYSVFYGQVPLEISQLSNLSSLDLFNNDLELKRPSLSSLIRNLSKLKHLHLGSADLSSSAVPVFLENFTSLTSLLLSDCQLHGEFPSAIFHLPNLQILNLRNNPRLTGYLPAKFHSDSPLKELLLLNTSFSGKISPSIGNLRSLESLDFGDCRFQGAVPSSLGRLTRLTYLDLQGNVFEGGQIPSFLQNLTKLTGLRLSESELGGGIPSWLGNLTQLNRLSFATNKLHGLVPSSLGRLTRLTYLGISMNNFTGQIPCFLQNLTQLTLLDLGSNKFTGQVPSWLGNLTQLTFLQFGGNELHGPVPYSIARLTSLKTLYLHSNELSGTLDFDMFLGLKNLRTLVLSGNKLSVLTESSSNTNGTFPSFQKLGLSSCNLTLFPDLLKYQDGLQMLDLRGNQLHGQIPNWIWNTSTETMFYVDISENSLTGFDQPLVFIPWVNLIWLDLSFNKLQGQLPIPPPTTMGYIVTNNKLSGEILPFFCNLSSLLLLELSNNLLTGMPPCLGDVNTLLVLNMSNNHILGSIPRICASKSNLRMIDLSNNQFQGRLPQMLADCTMLEVLSLGNNRLNDVFPSWLGTLPKLRLLVLRSNSLHGVIVRKQNDRKPEFFSSLHVFDISNNSFTGPLPSEYFKKWNGMKVKDYGKSSYLVANFSNEIYFISDLAYSITIKNKGIDILYGKIQEALSVIDLSCNRFEGSISDSLGNLQGLQVLNLSNNMLTGSIPSSLGSITELESLDLSHNVLSGQIPPQLAQLTFLAVFVVSHNRLTGHILQGNQFNTFGITSYEGNLGLCGHPLPKECGEDSSPPSGFVDEHQNSESPFEFYWMTIVPGYVCGLVIGVVAGQIVATKKHYWFVKTFGQLKLKGRKGKKGRR